MDNELMTFGSGERISFYQLFASKDYKVEIPIIQRDYAQGRSQEREVRNTFLNALYQYLEGGKSHNDLDFVYGSIEQKNGVPHFIPLDGQQRLTTLFLLHWYLAHVSGNAEHFRSVLGVGGLSRFRYETRPSSSEFCDALLANPVDMSSLKNGCETSLSEAIQDNGWFYLSWIYDPTIRSMLTMLDAIHGVFHGRPDFYQRLTDLEKPAITFLFLNLRDFYLTEDLYIKMNARGKPLTDFENFKAKLEKVLKGYKDGWPSYHLDFHAGPVDGYNYFIHKIDTDWTDFFWSYKNVSSQDDCFDDEIMLFIAMVIINHHLLNTDTPEQDQEKLFEGGGRIASLSFMEYEQLGCLTQSMLIDLIKMMDEVCELHRREVVPDPYCYKEESGFLGIIRNDSSYVEKLRFFAFYSYLMNHESRDGLYDWMRVIYNLTQNSVLDNNKSYLGALKAIDSLAKADVEIIEWLKQGRPISGFAEAQVLEERIKAHLVTKSAEWKNCILSFEKHAFFKGQIGFALKFAGIVDFYETHQGMEFDSETNAKYFQEFERYTRAASGVFDIIKDDSGKLDFAWERAVLSKGVYFTTATADRYNLLSTRLVKGHLDRDHSWQRLLRLSLQPNSDWDRRQSFVQAVFDDPDFDDKAIPASLNQICQKSLESGKLQEWQVKLIRYPELFRVCWQGYVVKNNAEFILLHEAKRSHYHCELFTKALEIEMRSQQKEFAPFHTIGGIDVRSREERSFLFMQGFACKGVSYLMHINYESNAYKACFFASDYSVVDEFLESILLQSNFLKNSSQARFELVMASEIGIIRTIKYLCEKLRGIQ